MHNIFVVIIVINIILYCITSTLYRRRLELFL